ncbi:response regulator [Deinococcus oregonensis]|uniref:Response regulator n=1 Tax=Deinococcus oregonensis TaxID=1805970 RepID=A0ABV6AVN3_9DEIO
MLEENGEQTGGYENNMSRFLHIVVVDDNMTDLMLVEEVFATFNDQVTIKTYQSGQAALDAMRTPKAVLPDVLLLDINMPNMSGFDVLKVMKANERLKLIPVVTLTASVLPEDLVQAYSLYASSYLVKSVGFASFLQQVKGFLAFWKLNRLLDWPIPSSTRP